VNSALVNLDLSYMPTLTKVCVWESFPEGVTVDTAGSPNVVFTTECAGTGIERHHLSEISIYPNPANDLITIELGTDGRFTIEIVSLSGQLLYSGKMEGLSHELDLSSFQHGVYFITVRSKKFIKTEKIIKL
jgi:hypothetical protein